MQRDPGRLEDAARRRAAGARGGSGANDTIDVRTVGASNMRYHADATLLTCSSAGPSSSWSEGAILTCTSPRAQASSLLSKLALEAAGYGGGGSSRDRPDEPWVEPLLRGMMEVMHDRWVASAQVVQYLGTAAHCRLPPAAGVKAGCRPPAVIPTAKVCCRAQVAQALLDGLVARYPGASACASCSATWRRWRAPTGC